MDKNSLVIDILAVTSRTVPAPENSESMSSAQLRDYAAKILAETSVREFLSEFQFIKLVPDNIKIVGPDEAVVRPVYTSPAFLEYKRDAAADEEKMSNKAKLIEARRLNAYEARSSYDYSATGDFIAFNGWVFGERCGIPEDRWECDVFLKVDKHDDSVRHTFVVLFESNSPEVKEAYLVR